MEGTCADAVLQLAAMASAAGAGGAVCSPLEVAGVRERFPGGTLVVPGIRPASAAADDQSRIATPALAVASGADYLVIGRPITRVRGPGRRRRRYRARDRRLRVTFLGTGTSIGVPVITCNCRVCRSDDPRDNRTRPSILMEWDGHAVLVDTSPDFRQQALRHCMQRLDAVLFTHRHADHILGLDDIRLFNWRQKMAMPAYGSKATLDALRRTFWYVFEESQKGGGKPAMNLNPVTGPFDLLGREIIPVPVLHGEMEIYGYRIGNFAYLTDVSQVPDHSMALLQGVDVAVVSALRPTPHSTHQSVEQAVQLSRKIGASRTFFTHMCHDILHAETDEELPEGIALAYDGLVLDNLA